VAQNFEILNFVPHFLWKNSVTQTCCDANLLWHEFIVIQRWWQKKFLSCLIVDW